MPRKQPALDDGYVSVTHKNAPELLKEKENIGREAFKAQEYPTAVQIYEECIGFLQWVPEERQLSDAARYLTNMAAAQFAMGRCEESLASADRALELDKTYVKAHYRRAKALGELQRHVDALAAYLAAQALDPENGVLKEQIAILDGVLSPADQYAARAKLVDPSKVGPAPADAAVHEVSESGAFDLSADPVKKRVTERSRKHKEAMERAKRDVERYQLHCDRVDAANAAERARLGIPCEGWDPTFAPKPPPTMRPFDGTEPVLPKTAAPADLPGLDPDGPQELAPIYKQCNPKFEKFSWANKTVEELRIYVKLDDGDDVDAVDVDAPVKHVGTDHLGYRTSTNGDVTCTVTVHNWSHIQLQIDVKFPNGPLSFPRPFVRRGASGFFSRHAALRDRAPLRQGQVHGHDQEEAQAHLPPPEARHVGRRVDGRRGEHVAPDLLEHEVRQARRLGGLKFSRTGGPRGRRLGGVQNSS